MVFAFKLLYLSPIISFIVTLIATPILIRYLNRIGLQVKDQNKENKPLVPISGGLAVISGILVGLMFYIFVLTFVYNDKTQFGLIFASLTTILLITFIGFMDDLIINKTKDSSVGLKQWQKPFLTIIAAVPLVVINAGVSKMAVPFFGVIDFGLLYPLLLIPIGVVGASNMVNLLAGINGLETGMGLVYFSMLGVYSYYHIRFEAAAISIILVGALIAFYYFNKFPAKILPGDSLTYLLGAAIAVVAIIGNIERAALIVSIPFIFEFLLKARSKFKAQSYGTYINGKIQSLYPNKIYSLIHLMTIKPKFTEKQITYVFIIIMLIISSLIWLIQNV
ncbi:hypothetical protein HYV88_00215 [Candidatus Woesearchaeota archaeon]|nr:hypothetical protein [Candidatus Woesearchaeota archaeon]